MSLRWNYTLGSGEMVILTQWKIDETDIGLLTSVPTIYDNRFIISTSEVATVIIKNVADITDATFECKVRTSVGPWKYKVSVEITGERKNLKFNDCVIYTMVIILKFPSSTMGVFITNELIDIKLSSEGLPWLFRN